jgi:hypothetical protein
MLHLTSLTGPGNEKRTLPDIQELLNIHLH